MLSTFMSTLYNDLLADNFPISLSIAVSSFSEKPSSLIIEQDSGLSIKSNFRPDTASLISRSSIIVSHAFT